MLRSADWEFGKCGLCQHLVLKLLASLSCCSPPRLPSAMAAFRGVWASTWPLEVGDAAKLACTGSLLCNLYQETVRVRKEEDRRLDLEALLDDEEKAHDQELMLEDWRRRWAPWS